MPVTEKSEAAKLKEQVKDLKAKVSSAEQANGVLSKQAGEANSELRKFAAVQDELKEVKAAFKDLEAERNRLAATVSSLSAKAEEAEQVLQAAKDFKSLLAKV